MLGCIDQGNARADALDPLDIFAAQSVVDILSGNRREEPGGTLEQIRIGKFHARLFFSGQGMSREIAMLCAGTEDASRAREHLRFGATDVRK